MAQPALLHALLDSVTDSITTYVRYQADAGAQVVQIFDSWGCCLHPGDWDVFSGQYIARIVRDVKATHPHLPLIVYSYGSGGMLERMAATGVDVVSVDQHVALEDARRRLGPAVGVQGNLDPAWLHADAAFIRARVADAARAGGATRHVLNLGHGVMPNTPEAGVAAFFDACKSL